MTDWLTASRSTGLSHGGTAKHYPLFSSTKLFKVSHPAAKRLFYLSNFALGYSREALVEFSQETPIPLALK